MQFTEEQRTEIYTVYYPKVIGYLINHVNNRSLAEDIASDVFLKVYEKLDRFDPKKSSISTWIFTVMRNTLTDHYRTRRVFEEIPETLADGSDVEEEVCNAEMLNSLADALEVLDERERDIILLRFYSGKTLKEIAEKMGISYAYVKVLQNKAFVEIKNHMEKK